MTTEEQPQVAPEVVAAAPAEAPAAEAEVAAAPAGKGRKQHTLVEGEEELTLPTDGTRIKKPVRPDDSDVRKAIDALQDTISKSKKRIEAIKEEIDARRSGRTKGSSEQQGVKNQLAELRGKFQTLLGQKQNCRAQLDVLAKARESARASVNSLKSSVKFTSVEQIDARIAELEAEIQHSSLTLNEEKNRLEQIKQLKKTKGSVGQLASQVAQLNTDSASVDDLRETIKKLDEQLNGVKAEEEVLRSKLNDLKAKEAEQGSDIPGLIQERDECREVCKAAYAKIQDLRGEHDAEWVTYKRQNKLYRMQLDADRQKRNELFAKERAERDAARAARVAENMPEPFDKEVTTCEQLASYLAKFKVSNGPAASEERKAVEAPAGFKPLEKKSDEGDAWLMGKGSKKKGKGSKAADKPAAAAAPTGARLVHSVDILEAFALLRLEIPATAAKAAELLPEVESKKAAFLAKRQEVKDKPEEPAVAAESSENGGADTAVAASAAPAAEDKAEEGSKAGAKVAVGKKGGKAPPKLDDAESWPSIGGGHAPTKPAGDEETGEGEAATAWGVKPAANGYLSVKLIVSASEHVSVSIN